MSAELKVLNSVLQTKDIGTLLTNDVEPFFYAYGDVYEFIGDYYKNYRAVPDIGIVQSKFPGFDEVSVTGDTSYHLDELRQEYIKNRLDSLLVSAAKKLRDGEPAPKVLEGLGVQVGKVQRYTSSVRDLNLMDVEDAARHFDRVKTRTELMGGTPGIPTMFKSIDSTYTTGMSPGHMIVVIGWPGKAKTFFSSLLAVRAWQQGFKPMIISLEMDPETMRNRIYAEMGEGMFSISGLNRGDVNLDDFRSFTKRNFADKDGFIVVAPEGVGEVTPNIVQGKIDQHKPDLVICDYHQLFSDNAKTQDPTRRGMALSRELKLLATRNQIPLIDITAATGSDVSDREQPPIMAQVAWSKSIEYDADLALSVHKHDDSGLVEINGLKNRHGDLFNFLLDWDIDRGIVTEKF